MGSHFPHGAVALTEQDFFTDNGYSRAPRLVQWMVTGRCPLSCPHCLAAGVRDGEDELSLREASSLVEELAALGVEQVLLTGGEPCARADLGEIVRLLGEAGLRYSLNTALHPDPRLLCALEQHPPSFVAVSLDGPPAFHDAFRGRAGAGEEALRSLALFAQLCPGQVAAGTTVTSRSFPFLAETFFRVVESGASEWGLHLVVPEGRAARREDLLLTTRQLRELIRFAANRRQSFPVTLADEIGYCGPWEPLLRDGPFFCGAGRVQCVVLPDGEVVPCTTTDRSTSAGNLRRAPLARIWAEGFAELRRPAAARGCERCAELVRCEGGCWLQRRHGAHCFRRAWALPRATWAAGLALSLGLAAGDAAAQPVPPARPPRPVVPAAGQMEILQQQIVLWHAGQARGASDAASIRQALQKELPGDPGAAYVLAYLSPGARPGSFAARGREIDRALTTRQRSLCLVGLAWRDLAELALDGGAPGARGAREALALREAMTSLATTAERWRLEIFRGKLDPFLRRTGAYRHFFLSKAGPPPWFRARGALAHKRGWTRPDLSEKTLAQHPFGEVMQLRLRARFGAGIDLLRRGKRLPFDGVVGPMDLLLVPASGIEPRVTATIAGKTLAVLLPRGATLGHPDLLRLTHEQHRDALLALARGASTETLSPWLLPALRAEVKAGGAGAIRARWLLHSLYLF